MLVNKTVQNRYAIVISAQNRHIAPKNQGDVEVTYSDEMVLPLHALCKPCETSQF